MIRTGIVFLSVFLFLVSCSQSRQSDKKLSQPDTEGKLFIIGGGKKPDKMLQNLAHISGVDSSGYVIILPMSSSVPDTSGYYMRKDFMKVNVKSTSVFNLQTEEQMTDSKLDSIRNAALIYITGGNQNTFMEIASGTPLVQAIRDAYKKGATVAGTSAGAAVMSKQMITGDEFKHPEYTGNFRTIEANNMEIDTGLGLIKSAIIDQHFIQRMRMNRLITVILENPSKVGIGIDESTAILVDGNKADIYGIGQVVVLRNIEGETRVKNGLLGGNNLSLSIYLPGESFKIKEK
jgi:cyanophycinase